MAQSEINQVLDVDCEKLFKAITNYTRYPEFVDGCSGAKIEKQEGPKTTVQYMVSMIKEISYTLEHTDDPTSKKTSWNLLKSDFLKKNTGSWQLKAVGPGKTEVKYQIEVEFKIPVPGMILNRLVKSSLPSMLKNFEKEAKNG